MVYCRVYLLQDQSKKKEEAHISEYTRVCVCVFVIIGVHLSGMRNHYFSSQFWWTSLTLLSCEWPVRHLCMFVNGQLNELINPTNNLFICIAKMLSLSLTHSLNLWLTPRVVRHLHRSHICSACTILSQLKLQTCMIFF